MRINTKVHYLTKTTSFNIVGQICPQDNLKSFLKALASKYDYLS